MTDLLAEIRVVSLTGSGGFGKTRLFEVRARLVDSAFRMDDGNARAVAETCRHLDGVPSAIQLAAARVRVLTPRPIAAGLSDRFGLLTGGLRGAASAGGGHRSMRTTE